MKNYVQKFERGDDDLSGSYFHEWFQMRIIIGVG